MTRKLALLVLAVMLVVPLSGFDSAPTDASIYVVHGIPGEDLGLDPALPVDVSVDGACALPGFTFGEIVGPLAMPAGSYEVAISLVADEPCTGAVVIGPVTLDFAAGENYSVVAHLTEEGGITASLFTNDLSALSGRQARVIAHHLAAAPAVDVRLRQVKKQGHAEKIKVEDFVNGQQVAAELRAGRWKLSIAPAGAADPVFGPVKLKLKPFTAYLVYAVGSLENGTFTLLIEAVGGLR